MGLTILFQIFNERATEGIYLHKTFSVTRTANIVEYHWVASLLVIQASKTTRKVSLF